MADAGPAQSQPPSGTDSDPERIKHLTYRERQLLPLVCGGLRNKEIAKQLGISESTVWHHSRLFLPSLKWRIAWRWLPLYTVTISSSTTAWVAILFD
jgi:FixJ family two-component response regulator